MTASLFDGLIWYYRGIMPSERVQRQIDRLLKEAEKAIANDDWATIQARAQKVLTFD